MIGAAWGKRPRNAATTKVGRVERVASWWDGFELWLTGLSFVPQTALVLIVMVPLCAGAAWVLDRVIAAAFAAVGRREPEPPGPDSEDC
jgi:hypothetical protein